MHVASSRRSTWAGAALGLLLGLLPAWVAAAPNEGDDAAGGGNAPQATTPGPTDPYDRDVPQSALRGYLEAARARDYERAANYLDLRPVPESRRGTQGPRLARQLKTVIDQTLWVDLDALSTDPEGRQDDGLRPDRDLVGVVETSSGPLEITLERVARDDGVPIWKISASTVSRIPALHAEFGLGWLERYLPPLLVDVQVLELALWQWVALLAILLLAFLFSLLVAGTVLRLLRPWVRRTGTAVDDQLLDVVVGPLRLLSGLVVFHLAWLTLGLSVPAQTVLRNTEKVLVIFAAAWGLFRVADIFARTLEGRLAAREEPGAASLIPMGRKTIKAFVAVLAVLAALDSFGFDVTAVLAGLGVGGIAVALAAQKSVENLFGTVTLMSDRPVRPGDFCRFGDRVGTVEEIGLRSTRVRTLDRTLVTIPNAEFSTIHLENFTARDRIRFHAMLGLRYETSPDQMRHLLKEIRRLLLSHPRVTVDPARVRFVGFGAYSLDLEIFAYVDTADWNEFLAIREDLLLRLMDVVASSGTGFAFPSQTNYVAHDGGLDAERTKLAEEEIRELVEKRELPLPDYTEETRREFARSLEYPPPGSVLRRD